MYLTTKGEIDVKYSIVPRLGVIDCNVDEEENRKYLDYDEYNLGFNPLEL